MKRTLWLFLSMTIIILAALFARVNQKTSFAMSASKAPRADAKKTNSQGHWERVWRTEGAVYDFHAFDENAIVGVGAEGMVISSTDGGVYWHYQAAGDADLHALAAASNTLWAAGDQGVVIKSQDRGAAWEPVDAGTSETINDIATVGGVKVWIAGDNGLLARTNDGGATWTTLNSGVTTNLNAIAMFPDGVHGIAAGDGGVLLATSDGGDSWTPRTGVIPSSDNLADIYIYGDKAWAAGSYGQVYFSADMGATWAKLASLWFNITNIEMAPEQDQLGWLVGLDGRIASTTNGGQSWSANKGDEGYHLHALALSDAAHIWTGGYVMTSNNYPDWGYAPDTPSWFIWKSADGGAGWSAPVSGLFPWFYNVTAVTKQDAYVVGQDLQIMKTQDGGFSWREIHSELASNPDIVPSEADSRGKALHGISCAPGDPQDCHAAGRNELVVHTTDGGQTWTRETVPGWGKSIYDIAMTTAASGVAVSRNYNYFTEDGVHWEGAFDNGVGRTHLDLDMINSWQGAVSTKKALFDYTVDAGRHWRGYPLPVFGSGTFFFNSGVDALDIDNDGKLDYVWLAGCSEAYQDGPCKEGLVIFNPDALNDPAGWRPVLLDEDVSRLQKIEMVNEKEGWVVGYDAEIRFTEDGGGVWTKQEAPTDANLYGLDVFDRNLAYAVGLRGDILRYSEPDRRLNANPQWRNKIDGYLDEWNALNARQIDSTEMDSIVGETPDPQDLNANTRVRWDDAGLYFGIEVTDATLAASGDAIDQLGIALDGLDDGAVGDDDHTIRFFANGQAEMDGAPMPASDYAIATSANGYTIEAFVSQEALGDGFRHLRKVGINIALYDAVPGEDAYKTRMFWTGASLDGSPDDYGSVTLYLFDRNQLAQTGVPTERIEIDGNLDDWSDEETYRLNTGNADSIQGEPPTGDADLSADFRMRWWDDYLFIGVEVSDDVLMAGDSVAIAFDVDNDSRLTPPDVTLRVWPDGRVRINDVPGGPVLAKGNPTDAGYLVEMAIPASILGGPFSPNQTLHFNYGLWDYDTTEAQPDSVMNWQGASIDGVRADYGWLKLSPVTRLIKAERDDPRFQDTFINEWSPTSNYARLDTMRIRIDGIETPLVRFDVDSVIPQNARLIYSLLGLYTVEDKGHSKFTARIYRMLRAWVEDEVTWQQPAAHQSWETPGAKGPTDQAQTPTDVKELNFRDENGNCGDRNATWFEVTSDVSDFVSGAAPNYGWALRGEAGAQINYVLASSQHDTPDCRPEIYFEYIFPSGEIPTPTPAPLTIYLPIISP